MHALLTAVMQDKPCVDPSLHNAIETTPFAMLSIAQQCYYVVHMISVTRALLYDDQSAYSQTVQRLVEKLPDDTKDAPKHPPLPSQHVSRRASQFSNDPNNARNSSSSITSSSVLTAKGGGGGGRGTPLTSPKLPVPPPPLSDVAPAPPSPPPLLPVIPACKLDISIAIIGGGAVVRQLLHLLLDDHPSLLHPTRITVITRQPEKLNIFAAQGVMCLGRKHGTEALNRCHALILACQPSQLDDVIQNHFSAKAYGNDPLHQVARLKGSTVVISCLAGFPKVKLAQLLHHDQRLIIRTRVASMSALPTVADEHELLVRDCMAVRVQNMADHDSFLKDAVKQAEQHRINQAVSRLMDLQYRDPGEHSALPFDLARRAALNAVLEEDRSRVHPKPANELLLETYDVEYPFLLVVWQAIQTYVAAEFDIKEGERAKRAMALRSLQHPGAGQDGAAVTEVKRTGALPQRRRHGGNAKEEAHSAATKSEGPLLCAALATLPASVHQAVVENIVCRYAPPTPNAGLFSSAPVPSISGKELGESLSPSTASFAGKVESERVARTILRRLATVFRDEGQLARHLQQHYRDVLRPEEGIHSKLV